MGANLAVFDLAFVEHLDQGRAGNAEHVGCFLGGQFGMNWDHRNGVSATHSLRIPTSILTAEAGSTTVSSSGRSDYSESKRSLRAKPGGE